MTCVSASAALFDEARPEGEDGYNTTSRFGGRYPGDDCVRRVFKKMQSRPQIEVVAAAPWQYGKATQSRAK